MDQSLVREEGDSMEKNDFVNPSFVEEPMMTSRVQPRHIYLEKKLLNHIFETMENQISEIIEQIKAPMNPPQNDGKQEDAVDLPSPYVIRAKDVGDSTPIKRKRGRKPTSMLCGEIFVSLQLPKDEIMNNIDFNNVSSITKVGGKTISPTFSLKERLQDWKIEQKQLKVGSSKYYIYHHSLSGKIFRSKPEVVQFVLTETCPPKPGTSRNQPSKGRKRRNKRTKVGEVNVVEDVVSNQLNDAALVNQDPILGSNASTIMTRVSSNHEELQIDELMSTEDMLNEFSIAFQRGEL